MGAVRVLRSCKSGLQIWLLKYLQFSRFDVFEIWRKVGIQKKFIDCEITNPVIGCCQSTLKACRFGFQYMRFFMSCKKLEAPEVRNTLVFIEASVPI